VSPDGAKNGSKRRRAGARLGSDPFGVVRFLTAPGGLRRQLFSGTSGPRAAPDAISEATALTILLPGALSSPAYAVEEGPSGDISVRINRLEDAAKLQEALKSLAVKADVQYLNDGMQCSPNRFQPTLRHRPAARSSPLGPMASPSNSTAGTGAAAKLWSSPPPTSRPGSTARSASRPVPLRPAVRHRSSSTRQDPPGGDQVARADAMSPLTWWADHDRQTRCRIQTRRSSMKSSRPIAGGQQRTCWRSRPGSGRLPAGEPSSRCRRSRS
jgi:hypothetical protein